MSDPIEIELTTTGGVRSNASAAMPALLYGRVLDNLLSNALCATGRRGRIVVSIRHDAVGLVTTVTDDGPGMSPEFLPHAFDRFSQEDIARARGAGSGLGLAIVSAAATAAGGSVALENQPDGGLRVTVTIPSG